jgi:hypothetical protein
MLPTKQGNTEHRRKGAATKQLGTRVPVQLWEWLRKAAFARKESMSKFLTRNLEEIRAGSAKRS